MIFNSYIYFYHLDKFCVLPDYPETITDTMGAHFADSNALARTAPVYSYKNSGPRSISGITLKLHRDMMEGLNFNVSNLKDNVVDFSGDDYIDILIKHLQAVAYPKYNEYSSGAKVVIPPMVAVRFGNDIFIKGVVTSDISLTYEKPILWNDKYAVITISFTITEVDPYDVDTIVEEGSFRGVVRAFKDGIYKDTTASPTYMQTTITNQDYTNDKKQEDTETKTKPIDTQTTYGIPISVPVMGIDGPLGNSTTSSSNFGGNGNSQPTTQADR